MKKIIWIAMFYFIVIMLSGCGSETWERTTEEQIVTTEESTHKQTKEQAPKTPLEEFGEYYSSLIESNELGKAEEYKISRMMTWEEASALAGTDLAFAHFEGYKDFRFFSKGVIIAEADVNQDGFEDIIEYCPLICSELDATAHEEEYSLTIYKGSEQGCYELLYSQPNFVYSGTWGNEITIYCYGKEVFLMFRNTRSFRDYSYDYINEKANTIYWIRNENVAGQLYLSFYWEYMNANIVQCKEEYKKEADELVKNNLQISTESCTGISYDKTIRNCFWGSAEKEASDVQEDYLYKIYCNKLDTIKSKININNLDLAYTTRYLTKQSFSCNIDNAGKEEKYFKFENILGFVYEAPSLGNLPFISGELYGTHEGKWGLVYQMEMDGKATDFEQMCGLDIWSGEFTPRMFWVEKVRGKNITYIQYKNEQRCYKIIGYEIQGDQYKQVFAVESSPVIRISPNTTYSYKEEGEYHNLPYSVSMNYMTGGYIEIYGMKDQELQARINENIRELIEEEGKKYKGERKLTKVDPNFRVRDNSEEKLELEYVGVYKMGSMEDPSYDFHFMYFTVDMKTGECTLLEKKQDMGEERW